MASNAPWLLGLDLSLQLQYVLGWPAIQLVPHARFDIRDHHVAQFTHKHTMKHGQTLRRGVVVKHLDVPGGLQQIKRILPWLLKLRIEFEISSLEC